MFFSKIVSDALNFAKSGDSVQAISLLSDAEEFAYREYGVLRKSELELLNLIRKKYNLSKTISEEKQFDSSSFPKDLSGSLSFQMGSRLGDGCVNPLPGVSVVTCCKNRSENLIKALPTWLQHDEVREVIVVDWCSDISVLKSIKDAGITDDRVVVVRVEDEPRWILSYAFNVGFRCAQHKVILKVDADITLKADFFKKNLLADGCFIAGDWQKAEKGQEHINGFFYVRLKDLLRIKGFNEYITTYGWDDDDIYFRLINSGLRRVCVDVASIYHIPHDDAQRLDGAVGGVDNAASQLAGDTLFKIRANRYIASVMPQWSQDRLFSPYEVQFSEGSYIKIKRVLEEMPHLVSADIRRDAENYAALELISWLVGPKIYHLNREVFQKYLSIKKLEEISKFDVDVACQGEVLPDHLKRRSLYLEFESPISESALLRFIDFLSFSLSPSDGVSVFARGRDDVIERFSKAFKSPVFILKKWVTDSGLTRLDKGKIRDFRDRINQGSGVVIKVDADLLSNLPSPRAPFTYVRKPRLYIDAQHGLGNRLRALGSAAAVAKQASRELVVLWTPDHHCQCSLSDIYDYSGALIESADELPENIFRYNYMEMESGALKGELINTDLAEDIVVRSAFVLTHPASSWDSENQFLRELRPSETVRKLVDSVQIPVDCLGAHVRMEAGAGLDHNTYDSPENWSEESHAQIHFWRSKSHYSAFMRRIDELLAQGVHNHLFLATDLPENYTAFQKTYKEKLKYLSRTLYDRSKEQIQYALADAILLSRCSLLLGSTWSSFSELSMRLSTTIKKIEMSGVDF